MNTDENTSPYRMTARIETGYRLKARGDKMVSTIFPIVSLSTAATKLTTVVTARCGCCRVGDRWQCGQRLDVDVTG